MKKEKTIIEAICDFCNGKADFSCNVCGKDVCGNCALYLCKHVTPPRNIFTDSATFYPVGFPQEYYSPIANRIFCPDCIEAFKITIAITAGKRK